MKFKFIALSLLLSSVCSANSIDLASPISVTPKGVDAFEVTGFSFPSSRIFSKSVRVGNEAVQVRYKIIFSHGGSYKGQGQYLMGAQAVLLSAESSNNAKVKLSFRQVDVTNLGSNSSPIAGLIMEIVTKVKIKTETKESRELFKLTGDGNISKLN